MPSPLRVWSRARSGPIEGNGETVTAKGVLPSGTRIGTHLIEATMKTKTTDTTDVLRRRVRLITLLQQRGGMSRFVAAEQLGRDPRTIQRDLAWLREHGVQVTSEQTSATAPAAWSVPKKWSADKWLWTLLTERENEKTARFGLFEHKIDETGKPIGTPLRRYESTEQSRLARECDRDAREIERQDDSLKAAGHTQNEIEDMDASGELA